MAGHSDDGVVPTEGMQAGGVAAESASAEREAAVAGEER
jgi:hypothetical protein